MSNLAACIFARGGSKGLPNKNTLNFAGKPLIAWAVEQALALSTIDEVFVSTDSVEIAEIAQKLLKAADSWLGSKVLDYQIHRWRYSQVAVSYGEPCLVLGEPGPLILAGDGFLAPKIEGAVLSGLAAARSLLPLR